MPGSRVALVTGASSGIGAQTALLLQAAGFTVYAAARRVERMQPLADRGVRTLSMDVTDDSSMTAGLAKIIEAAGRIDVLVNNAGYGSYGSVEDVPIGEARRQFEVNVFGLARLIQLAVPRMRAQGSGRIINVSSIGGKRPGRWPGGWSPRTTRAPPPGRTWWPGRLLPRRPRGSRGPGTRWARGRARSCAPARSCPTARLTRSSPAPTRTRPPRNGAP
jgi:NAD(P)-dependent dehydrogenase (short-subunit alcohol dehydrogenase family)